MFKRRHTAVVASIRSPASALLAMSLALLAACSSDPGASGSTDTVADSVADAADTQDAAADVVKPPTLKATVKATPASGNAPLPCELTVTIDGAPLEELFVTWDFGDGTAAETYDLSLPEEQKGINVKHEFPYKGSYNVRAKVTWRKNNKIKVEAGATVEVKDPVSVSLGSIDLVSSPTVALGGDVSLTTSVQNTGDEISEPFQVAVYLTSAEVLDPAAQPTYTYTIDKMAAGKETPAVIQFAWDPATKSGNPLTFQVPAGTADGDYFIHIVVDPAKKLNEVDTADNSGLAPNLLKVDNKVGAKPDLVITAPEFDTTVSHSPGEALNYTQEISNLGVGEAKASKFAVFLSADDKLDLDPKLAKDDPGQPDRMLTKLATSNLLKLAPKSTFPMSYSVILPEVADGSYYLIAVADILDALEETNESNNLSVSKDKLQLAKLVKQGVDLDLKAMTVKPKGTFLQGQVGVEWTIQNGGNQAIAQPSPAGIYFCPTKAFSKGTCIVNQKNFTIPPLAAGETKSGTELVTISKDTPVQNWFVYLRVDPDDKVSELDEGNNVGVFDNLIVTAQQNVDLWPSDVGVHPGSVQAGGKIKVSYTVRNSGTTGSAASTTWIALSTTDQCGASLVNTGVNVVIKEVVNAGVDALSETDVVDEVVVPLGLDHKVSQYTLCVILDAKNANTKETNKNNNAAGSKGKLEVLGAKGGCFEDAADQNGNNNTADKAAALPADAATLLGSCGDEDWWKIDVPKGHSLFVTQVATPLLATVPVPADLDLEIYAPDAKTVLDSQKLATAAKQATALTVATGGTHYLRVAAKANGSKAQYTLKVKVVAPPKGIDLLAGPLTVAPSVTFPGALVKTKVRLTNLGDQAAPALTVRYLLSQDQKPDGADKVMKDAVLAQGIAASQSTDYLQNLVLPIVPGGSWYVLAVLDPAGAIAETAEDNNISVSNLLQLSATQSCQPDSYAGNHTVDESAAIPPAGAQLKGLNVCPGLPDWYAIQVPTGKALSAKVNWKYQAGKGLVGVQIVDASKAGVLAGVASATNSVATVPYVQLGGTFYIHVYVLPESSAVPYDYDLEVSVKDPDPTDVCLADVYEGNNAPNAAPEVGCGQASLSLCLGDEDWFKLQLKKDEAISFDFNHPGSAFQLKLYDNPNLPAIKTLASNGKLPFTAPADGTYYLQVSYKTQGVKPANGFAYTLFVDGGKGVDLLAKFKSVFPSQIIQGEDVYMTVQLSNACQDAAQPFWYGYYFSADQKLDDSDVLMSLKPLAGLAGKTSQSVDDKAIVPTDAKPGPAYVIVAADATNAVAESQELNNTDATAIEVIKLCLADAFEPNGAPQIASPLMMGRVKDLSLCPYDLDWYTVDLKKGETLTVTADFQQDQGDLDIRLYKVNKFGAPMAVSATKKAPEQFSFVADEATKYYVRVSGFAGDGNAYQLTSCKSMSGKCIECIDDSVCDAAQQCDLATTTCGPKQCQPTDLSVCNDANQCTADQCIGGKCANVLAVKDFCSDGDPCTLGEACDGSGACITPKDTQVAALLSDTATQVDVGTDIATTADGGYVVVGGREVKAGELRGYVARFDSGGKLMWEKSLVAGNAPAVLQGVRIDGDQVVAVGYAGLADKLGVSGLWYVRVALADGATLVSSLQGVGALSAKLESLALLPGGDVIAVGTAYDAGTDGNGVDGWIGRIDPTGKLLWSSFAGGTGNDALADIALAMEGTAVTVVAVGQDDVGGGAVRGMYLHLAADGKLLASAAVPHGTANLVFTSVGMTAAGQVVVGGGSDAGQTVAKSYQSLLTRLGKDGKVVSQTLYPATTPQAKDFSGVKVSRFEAIRVLPDGSLVAVGSTGSGAEKTFQHDAALWRIAADDKVNAWWFYGGIGRDVLRGVVPWMGGWVAHGSVSELDPSSDALRLVVLPAQADCDDFNPCTIDTCAAGKGCQSTQMADGTACAGGTCQAGQCVAP